MHADSAPSADQLRAEVQGALDVFLAGQRAFLAEVSPDLDPMVTWLTGLLAGGKRLRPAFCFWAYVGVGGTDLAGAIRAASSLELVQACALIHDDVMDDSSTRRGMPAAHEAFAALHARSGWTGDARRFGDGAAILLGDLCLSWADELLYRSGLETEALERAKGVYDLMRAELMAGQYLDIVEQARGGGSLAGALRVVRYKSAKYTIERPLHLGALLAGASAEQVECLTDFGLPLGEAFQLRDDVLGVFGDPAQTGKPAGGDLREGKRTVLVAAALDSANPAQAQVLAERLGDKDLTDEQVDQVRRLFVATGALDRVEALIEARTSTARTALARCDLAPVARAALDDLALAATTRSV